MRRTVLRLSALALVAVAASGCAQLEGLLGRGRADATQGGTVIGYDPADRIKSDAEAMAAADKDATPSDDPVEP